MDTVQLPRGSSFLKKREITLAHAKKGAGRGTVSLYK